MATTIPGSDWLDLLAKFSPVSIISGGVGYLARLLQTGGRRRRMRAQLYREISNNYQNLVVRIALVTSIAGLRQAAAMSFNEKLDISFSVWNFYNDEKRRDMLFEINEAEAMGRIYDKFSRIGNESLAGYAHVRGKEAAAEVDDRLLDSTLDRKLYEKVSTPEAWRFLDDLLKGNRESHRKYLNPL